MAATTTTTAATKTTKLSVKPCIHVALLDGNKDNNYGNDDNECQRRGLVRKRTAFSYLVAQRRQQQQQLATTNNKCWTTRPCMQAHGIFISRCAKVTMTTTIGNNKRLVLDDKALYTSAQHISHCAQAHMLQVKHRCNNQPGNVKHRWARATLSDIDDLVRKRTRLSSLVRKHTSYSVKHRCKNQPFQHQA
jgi:hypothetical protein